MSLVNDPSLGERVAVLVDCDNTTPDALAFALRKIAQFGRIVVRRGYGNHNTLTAKWRESLLTHAFSPQLQFQYAAGKNTADIALALDAVELLFDNRADIFCIVTSDSDFAYLCRKLRERGARVYIVGEKKTPEALRNASDEFFELELLRKEPRPPGDHRGAAAAAPGVHHPATGPADRVDLADLADLAADVADLMASSAEGRVNVSSVGNYLKRADPGFDPKRYGFGRLLDLLQAIAAVRPGMEVIKDGSHWWLRQQEEPPEPARKRRGGKGRGSAARPASGETEPPVVELIDLVEPAPTAKASPRPARRPARKKKTADPSV